MINFDLKLIVIVIICVKGFKCQLENVKQEKCGFVGEQNSTFLCQSEDLTGI